MKLYDKIRLMPSLTSDNYTELVYSDGSMEKTIYHSFPNGLPEEWLVKPTKTEINNLKENWEESGLALVRYEDKILIDDLENHNLVMIFEENGKYSIFAGKRLIRSGEYWDLTKDLKFLYLDNKLVGQNLYEIKYRDKSRIQLVKAERIYLNLENARDYIYLDIEQNLIKKE